jgi:hypothetical protein
MVVSIDRVALDRAKRVKKSDFRCDARIFPEFAALS